jgi:hypothetical protein
MVFSGWTADEDKLFELVDHLPGEATEALLAEVRQGAHQRA